MSPSMPPLEEIEVDMLRTGSPDYMPHTPTASKIDRMLTPPPRNPGPPPAWQHPGDPFILYKPLNLCHYPLRIQLPEGETIEVQYIAFYLQAENPYMTGTMGFGCPMYGALLMAKEDMVGPPDEDSTHIAFDLTHIFYGQINEAMGTIGDPGLMADVARYCQIAKRRAELRMQERDLGRRWADMAQDLTQIVRRLKGAHAWQQIRLLVLSNQEHPLPVRREHSGSMAFRPYYHGEEAGQHHVPRQLAPAQWTYRPQTMTGSITCADSAGRRGTMPSGVGHLTSGVLKATVG
jgi:hypothetical protein